MAAIVRIKVDARNALKMIEGLGQALTPQKLLTAIGLRQLAWTDQWIKSAGNDTWKRMSWNTIASKPGRPALNNFSSRYVARLTQSMTSEVNADKGTVDVGTNEQYAKWQSEGTKPYIISPKAADGVLVFKVFGGAYGTFKGKSGSGIKFFKDVVFAREVHHPGIPARRLIPTEEVGLRLAQETIQAAVDKAMQNFQGSQGRA